MPFSVAKRGIDFVVSNAIELRAGRIDVSYHGGGEPTVNWRVLTQSLDYARQKAASANVEVWSAISTNGVLSDEKIDWIVRNLSGASVSFDGLPEVHDIHRLTRDGRGSSGRVMHTLGRFDAAGFKYGIRTTVTADEVSRLPDSIEFIFRNFHPGSVQVEPVYHLGRGKQAVSAETEEFIESYREAQRRVRQLGGTISFSAARIGMLTNHFCSATQGSLCLSANGNVTSCYEVFSEDRRWASKFFFGRPSPAGSGYEFDGQVLAGLQSQAVENRRHCQDCFAKWTCGGDCYHKALEYGGDDEFIGTGRCHVIRELTKDLILDKIADSGGLAWNEPWPVGGAHMTLAREGESEAAS